MGGGGPVLSVLLSDDEARWEAMDYIVGGVGVLVRGGAVVADHSDQKVRQGFITDRHPRTAVGIRKDGTWVLVVADGRQPELSKGGMTLAEVADFMKSLGCHEAINLDGGGSSTMWYQGRVLNSPSDGRERPVSDAILVFPR
jgi:exopolysaccharide biosynthesis protein